MSIQENKGVVRRYVEAINQQDYFHLYSAYGMITLGWHTSAA